MYENSIYVEKNIKRAKNLYRRSCDYFLKRGCTNKEILYSQSEPNRETQLLADTLINICKKRRESLACFYTDYYNFKKSGNKEALFRQYMGRCKPNGEKYCTNAAILLYDPKNIATHYKARKYFEKSCTLGDSRGCLYLGQLTAKGIGGKKDEKKAYKLIETVCGHTNLCDKKTYKEIAGKPITLKLYEEHIKTQTCSYILTKSNCN